MRQVGGAFRAEAICAGHVHLLLLLHLQLLHPEHWTWTKLGNELEFSFLKWISDTPKWLAFQGKGKGDPYLEKHRLAV